MQQHRLALTLRRRIAEALPAADITEQKRWFCRLCAQRCLLAAGMLPAEDALPSDSMPLFDGCPPVLPAALQPAAQTLREIPDAAWRADPELAGWLYQYCNAPEREAALAGLRQRRKIAPEQIPAATQLFTPDWLVQSMVQNTLGALLPPLPAWRYYLEAAPAPLPARTPGSLTLLDPCMGTGHILAYAFDALHALYLRDGWSPADAAEHILSHNLCGLDIDAEAVLLCDFVLRMKAAPSLPDILTRRIPTQLYHFGASPELENAALFGSLLRPAVPESPAARLLCRQYDAVITNPPYMGSSAMSRELSAFVRMHYPAGKADLFACFMERCAELTRQDGCFTMIVQHSWMFLSSFRRLREQMAQHSTLRSLVHLGARAFSLRDVGTIVQTAVFTAFGQPIPAYPTLYLRLTEQSDKESAYFDTSLRYTCTQESLSVIPGKPQCYWMSARMRDLMHEPKLGDHCRICQGMTTSDNKRFLRRWFEVPPGSIAFGCRDAAAAAATGMTWFPYNKGGRLRRWYGNHSWVINYRNGGEELRAFHAELSRDHSGGRLKNADTYFLPAVTWSFITDSTRFAVRQQPAGFLFDVAGSCLFPPQEEMLYLMGLLSSNVTLELLRLYNPTMNFQPENLKNLPYRDSPAHRAEISHLVAENIALARADWDEHEDSWDFRIHPLLCTGTPKLSGAYAAWLAQCRTRIAQMQSHEQRLNRLFLEIYGLQDELPDTPPASFLHLPSPADAAEGLVSFLTGCLLGRYSVAGIAPLPENFLPLQALPALLHTALRTVCGDACFSENAAWLDDALGMPLAEYCRRFLYPSHCRRYHKRPVYWLAQSGRHREICGLVYVHRFGADPLLPLLHAAEAAPATQEQQQYLTALRELSGIPYLPDTGILANHERFRTVFAAIR